MGKNDRIYFDIPDLMYLANKDIKSGKFFLNFSVRFSAIFHNSLLYFHAYTTLTAKVEYT